MKVEKSPKKPLIYYYALVLLALMLLNMFVFPSVMQRETEVDYSTFLQQLDAGEIQEVQVDDNQIVYIAKDQEGKDAVYITGRMDDPDLTSRLEGKGVTFSREIPRENSPLTNFLMTWVLPMLLMVLLGQMMVKSMQKRMGGANAMTFGKSNAKIYVKAQTGKTFRDVAGQDEAKEALQEIVDFLHNPRKYESIGAVMPKGALLVGPPGTGKTLLA